MLYLMDYNTMDIHTICIRHTMDLTVFCSPTVYVNKLELSRCPFDQTRVVDVRDAMATVGTNMATGAHVELEMSGGL